MKLLSSWEIRQLKKVLRQILYLIQRLRSESERGESFWRDQKSGGQAWGVDLKVGVGGGDRLWRWPESVRGGSGGRGPVSGGSFLNWQAKIKHGSIFIVLVLLTKSVIKH